MPIRTSLWTVSSPPQILAEATLPSEQKLEEMIVDAPGILSDEWMLIGRQEDTGFGGRIDLLAIAPDGSLILIELKRGRTPREVVAQAIDYAVWVDRLEAEDIAAIYGRFKRNADLAADFHGHFSVELDEDALNQSHQIIIVAESIDSSTERIVDYLNERDIPINVLCFQVFQFGNQQFLSRSWLIDPVQTQASASIGSQAPKEPWNGEFYISFGHDESRSWQDALDYGFISAGGGSWYSKTLQLLAPGDRVWVNVPGSGYVGVGRVTGRAQSAQEFRIQTDDGEKPIFDVPNHASYHQQFIDDEERCEYFVPVNWLDVVPLEGAFQELGLFGNQNSVCKPTTPKWRHTVERLKGRFPNYDRDRSPA